MTKSNIVYSLLSFTELDEATANTTIDEAGVSDEDVAEYILESYALLNFPLHKIDIVAEVYRFILEKCREEIEQKTGVDICNDLKSEVTVAGNYMCTSYDSSDFEETKKIIEKIPKFERSDTLDWFLSKLYNS